MFHAAEIEARILSPHLFFRALIDLRATDAIDWSMRYEWSNLKTEFWGQGGFIKNQKETGCAMKKRKSINDQMLEFSQGHLEIIDWFVIVWFACDNHDVQPRPFYFPFFFFYVSLSFYRSILIMTMNCAWKWTPTTDLPLRHRDNSIAI